MKVWKTGIRNSEFRRQNSEFRIPVLGCGYDSFADICLAGPSALHSGSIPPQLKLRFACFRWVSLTSLIFLPRKH